MRQPLDRIDLQHVQEVTLTRGYQIFDHFIQRMAEEARTALETADTHIEVCRLQGRLAALREVVRIPEKVRTEVNARDAKAAKR